MYAKVSIVGIAITLLMTLTLGILFILFIIEKNQAKQVIWIYGMMTSAVYNIILIMIIWIGIIGITKELKHAWWLTISAIPAELLALGFLLGYIK